jgi:hypothetical protein
MSNSFSIIEHTTPHTNHISHNLSKITINLMNVSRTSKNQQQPVHVLLISLRCHWATPRPRRRATPLPHAAGAGQAPLLELLSCRSRERSEIERDDTKKEMGMGEKRNEIRMLRDR